MASEPDKSPTTVLASVSPAEAAIEPSATRSLSFAIAASRATGIAAARGRQSGLSLSASDSYICNAQGLVCEMVPLLAPRAIVALLLVRKNFIEITPSIQHTDDFRNVIDDAIEDDVWAGDDRSEAWSHLVASSAGKRMILEKTTTFAYFTHDPICRVWAGHGCVIVPDFGEIGARIPVAYPRPCRSFTCRRNSSRSSGSPSPASSDRMPLSISARNWRSFSTCDRSRRPICS